MITHVLKVLTRSWHMFIALAKIMLPVMLVVQVARHFGLVDSAGQLLGPAMGLLNLPAEAGIVWATTMLVGIYGGLASLAALAGSFELNSAQLTALSAMMLIAHNIPVEQSIVRKAGASFTFTAILRIVTAAVYGGAVAWLSEWAGWMTDPVNLLWLQGSEFVSTAGGHPVWTWLRATLFSLVLTWLVILALIIVLDVFERLGITRRFTAAMTPVLRLSGLSAQVAPVTTVGVLLGLSYGGALIIEESTRQQFSARTRLLALSWLSLSHSLIEDTLLLLALGADIWVILVGRVALTLTIIAILARLTQRSSLIWARRTP